MAHSVVARGKGSNLGKGDTLMTRPLRQSDAQRVCLIIGLVDGCFDTSFIELGGLEGTLVLLCEEMIAAVQWMCEVNFGHILEVISDNL